MVLSIRKGFFTWLILDENKNTVVKIINKHLWGSEKKILDSKNKIAYITKVINESNNTNAYFKKYLLLKDNKPVVTASLSYSNDPKTIEVQTLSLRPPWIDKMQFATPYGLWQVNRQKDNGIIIFQSDNLIGKISPFFTFKQQLIEYSDDYDFSFIAGLYALIVYMLNDDDLILGYI